MRSDEVALRILEIISEVVEDVDCSNIDPDISLREQLGLDSVDFLDFVMALQRRYGIEVPEEDYRELTTLNSCMSYLAPKFQGKGSV